MLQYVARSAINTKHHIEKHANNIFQTTKVAVNLMLPVYFEADNYLSQEHYDVIVRSWVFLLSQTEPVESPSLGPNGHFTNFLRFHELFYLRLFDVSPMSIYFFSTPKSRTLFLQKLLCMLPHDSSEAPCASSYSFSMMLNAMVRQRTGKTSNILTNERRKVLTELVAEMDRKGMKPVEYGQLGEVLFWTLRKCLGSTTYEFVQSLWTKLFSQVLKFVVHKAVALGLKRQKQVRWNAWYESINLTGGTIRRIQILLRTLRKQSKDYNPSSESDSVSEVHAYSERSVAEAILQAGFESYDFETYESSIGRSKDRTVTDRSLQQALSPTINRNRLVTIMSGKGHEVCSPSISKRFSSRTSRRVMPMSNDIDSHQAVIEEKCSVRVMDIAIPSSDAESSTIMCSFIPSNNLPASAKALALDVSIRLN